MLSIFGFNYNRPQSLQSDSTSENSQNDVIVGSCPCCGTFVKIPETVCKYKCSVCQSTVSLIEDVPEIGNIKGMNYQSLKQLIRTCETKALVGTPKHEIYKPVEEYIELIFSSIYSLNKSFLLNNNSNLINYRDLEASFKLLTSLPTIRPYFKLLLASNELLRRPPINIKKISNIRWLLILFEIPGLANCLYHDRPNKLNRMNVPEIKSLSYEIIKRIIGYLSNVKSESLSFLYSYLSSLSTSKFGYKVQLLNLYITFHLTRLINKNISSKNKLKSSSPTFNEYSESSKLNSNRPEPKHWLIPLPISIQGFSNWGNKNKDNLPKTSELKLKVSDYGQEWHLKSAARLLSIFFIVNKDKLPIYTFYNSLIDFINVKQDFENWENSFKNKNLIYDLINPIKPELMICQYPFLLSLGCKISILEYEARKQMEKKAEEAFLKAINEKKIIDVNLKFLIRREFIMIDSLNCIKKNQNDLKKALKIEFHNEPGIDVGGLKKEWFLLLTKELFNVEGNGLFLIDEDSKLSWFAPMPIERNDELYYLLGVVLGLAIYNSIILDLRFPLALYKKLLNKKVLLEDFIEISPITGESLKKILNYTNEEFKTLGLTFEIEFKDFYGNIVNKKLIPNGDKIEVNYNNRKDFVNKWVDFYLNKMIESQFQSFYKGFHLVIGGNALSLFSPKEIEMLICGYNESKIEIELFKSITKYQGWISNKEAIESELIKWFWQWFNEIDFNKQKLFLKFVTGSDRIPATGITTMNFKITRLKLYDYHKVRKLPVAHTCFNELCIYEYETKKEMVDKLEMSITESEGFGLR